MRPTTISWKKQNKIKPRKFQITYLSGHVLGSPGEVSHLELEGPVLGVFTPALDNTDTLGTKFGHGTRPSHLVLSLFLVDVDTTPGQPVFVPAVTSDSHLGGVSK